MPNIALPLIAGLGAGAAIGYVASNMMGNQRPIATMSAYSIPAGQNYILYLQNFPPNVQLGSPQSLNPLTVVNLGTTDANGKLQLTAPAQGPAGRYAIIVWDLQTGQYCAVVTFSVT